MDSDNSTNAADLGSNVDSAPATLDNHGTNLDFIFTYNDDPSFHTGELRLYTGESSTHNPALSNSFKRTFTLRQLWFKCLEITKAFAKNCRRAISTKMGSKTGTSFE
ncbi:unnamed protein product [Colias eurytheme]|nr:unnamed protein product [Colias eurytheme]